MKEESLFTFSQSSKILISSSLLGMETSSSATHPMRHHTIQSPIILEPVTKTVSFTPVPTVCDRLLVPSSNAGTTSPCYLWISMPNYPPEYRLPGAYTDTQKIIVPTCCKNWWFGLIHIKKLSPGGGFSNRHEWCSSFNRSPI